MESKYKWYTLDNAAKVFPDTTNRTRSNVFRVAMILKEKIDPDILQAAVISLKERFPCYYVKLKRGMFWYYCEYNENLPTVRAESPYVCMAPNFKSKDGYLFNVFYYEKRIAVEMFHGLTDGNGLVEFIKSIVYRYLELKGYRLKSEGLVITLETQPHELETEDSFVKNYTTGARVRSDKEVAFKLRGTRFSESEGGGIINGKFKAAELLAITRKKGCTVTMFLAAAITWCIYELEKNKEVSKKPIKMFIPVNMRKLYDSKTLRNFVLYIYTCLHASERDWTFDEILNVMREQITENLKPENMQQTLNANVAIEMNYGLRLIPLFLKQFAIRIGFKMLGNKLMSCALSNLGDIQLPPGMQEHVECMEWAVGVARESTHDISVISNNGILSVNFMRSIYETDLEKNFFRFLAEQGITATVESNLWEEKV